MDRRQFLGKTGAAVAGAVTSANLGTSRAFAGQANLDTATQRIVIESMDSTCPARSGVAVGGIGAGCAELRKDGRFYNWSIFNNLPMYSGPKLDFEEDSILFFILRWQLPGKEPRMKLLQINDSPDFAGQESPLYYFPWLSCVEKIEYSAVFPFVNLKFTDPEMPVEVMMQAYSPFIPHDVKNSSLPVQIINLKVTSKTSEPVDVMLMGALRNCVGYDTRERFYATTLKEQADFKLCEMTCTGVEMTKSTFGTQSLVSMSPETTYNLGWEHRHPCLETALRENKLPNIDGTSERTTYDRQTGNRVALQRLFSTMAVSKKLARGRAFEHTFINAWHFPNLYTGGQRGQTGQVVGHYYCNFFDSASQVAEYVAQNKDDLHRRTKKFLQDFYDSTAPGFVLDQINSQLNTFITSSWLIKDGTFGVQEGLTAKQSWGPVATMDVSYYGSIPTSALFPELQKNMLLAHRKLQGTNGAVVHGLRKGFSSELRGTGGAFNRLDLPGQYVTMVLREYFWNNDRKWLEEMWPSVKAAIEYVLRERDLDGDSLPDMEGVMCSYDNFPMYGVASYIDSMWLAMMAHAVAAAKTIGDAEAEQKYAGILKRGVEKFEAKLWNEKYYRLWNDEGGKHGGLDEGCFTDQIIGQWAAHLAGLGDVFPNDHKKQALKSITEMSFKGDFGLRNCSWPGDKWWHDVAEKMWVDQLNTCWTGVELEFASLLIYEGMCEEGFAVIKAVDDRYRKAGLYWDHQEFGGHYFRPMSAWAIVNAMLGLGINAGTYSFNPKLPDKDLKLFFAFPTGTAHFIRKISPSAELVTIEVKTGQLTAERIVLATLKRRPSAADASITGEKLNIGQEGLAFCDNKVTIDLKPAVVVDAGHALQIRIV